MKDVCGERETEETETEREIDFLAWDSTGQPIQSEVSVLLEASKITPETGDLLILGIKLKSLCTLLYSES